MIVQHSRGNIQGHNQHPERVTSYEIGRRVRPSRLGGLVCYSNYIRQADQALSEKSALILLPLDCPQWIRDHHPDYRVLAIHAPSQECEGDVSDQDSPERPSWFRSMPFDTTWRKVCANRLSSMLVPQSSPSLSSRQFRANFPLQRSSYFWSTLRSQSVSLAFIWSQITVRS